MKTTYEQSVLLRIMKAGQTRLRLATDAGLDYQYFSRRLKLNKMPAEYKPKIETVLKKWGV